MNPDDIVWTRPGDAAVTIPAQQRPVSAEEPEPEADADTAGESVTSVPALVFSAPALSVAAFVYAAAQLISDTVPERLASMIPAANGNPADHVRVVSLFGLGLAGLGAVLAAAAFVRREAPGTPRWAGWLAGAAVAICVIVAAQSILLIILSGIAPSGATG